MTLRHRFYGSVSLLEAAWFHGQKVVIVRCGDCAARNIFVGDTRWQSPIVEVEAVWENLKHGGKHHDA